MTSGGGAETEPGGSGAGALRLLRGNQPFRSLWCARSTSFLGDSLGLVTLLLYTANTTGQALAVALLLLVGDFAPALLGPLTGVISDRFDLKRVMVLCELVQGVLVALIALTLPSLPLLLALVALRAIAGQIFQPASRVAVPALVRDRDLESANSALGFGMNGSEALGPLVAAALLPVMDVRGVLLVDAVTFVVSAALLAYLPSLPPAPAEEADRVSLLTDAKAGLRYIWSVPIAVCTVIDPPAPSMHASLTEKPPAPALVCHMVLRFNCTANCCIVRIIGLGSFAVVTLNGIDDVALVFLAKDSLGGGDPAASVLYAAVGVGLLVGYALLARYAGGVSTVFLLLLGFGLSSAGNLLSGLAWAVAATFVMQTIRGVGISAMDVATNTLIQRLVPPTMLGRVFGNLYGAIGIAAGLSYVLGGLLLDLTSPRPTFIIAGTGGLLATLATALVLRRAMKLTQSETPTLAGWPETD